MPTFETHDQCRIYYQTYGFEDPNPTIVFLNGTTQTTLYWLPLAKGVKGRYRVILYDARGQGKSSVGRKGLSLQNHIGDLTDLLGHLGAGRSHLVGLSHGAQVALGFAARHQTRVDRLILCSLGIDRGRYSRTVIYTWQKALEQGGVAAMAWASLPTVFGRAYLSGHRRWLDKTVAAIVARNNENQLASFLEAMCRYPEPDEFAPHIESPCLVLSGAEDPLVPEANARELAGLCAGRHRVFEKTGHSLPAEAPQQFLKVVLEFLEN